MGPIPRMRMIEAIEVLPSDALVPVSWVRVLLAMAMNGQLSPTTRDTPDPENGRPARSGTPCS